MRGLFFFGPGGDFPRRTGRSGLVAAQLGDGRAQQAHLHVLHHRLPRVFVPRLQVLERGVAVGALAVLEVELDEVPGPAVQAALQEALQDVWVRTGDALGAPHRRDGEGELGVELALLYLARSDVVDLGEQLGPVLSIGGGALHVLLRCLTVEVGDAPSNLLSLVLLVGPGLHDVHPPLLHLLLQRHHYRLLL